MTYIVAPNGVYSHHAATGNVIWDSNHLCPADKLTPEEATLFGVFPLIEVDPPPCGPDKTAVPEDPTLVDGQWLQQWAVRDATTDEMAQRALEARERFKAARTDAGDLPGDRAPMHQELTLTMPALSEAERSQMMQIMRANGIWKPVFISLLPRAGTAIEQDHMIYGKRKNTPMDLPYFATFAHSMEIESW